jgi:hypothetical protein
MHVEVFNGDADGLCALRQWRAQHGKAELSITGVKRDIALVQHVPQQATDVAIFDVSHRVNEAATAQRITTASIHYFDHHQVGNLPQNPNFHGHIDTDPMVCTAVLVWRHFAGSLPDWAITGAFGDNLLRTATSLSDANQTTLQRLEELGVLLNYNGYGTSIEDLHLHPAELADELDRYPNAETCAQQSTMVQHLRQGYAQDLAHIAALPTYADFGDSVVYLMPDTPWARRMSGTFANQAAQLRPNVAVAIAVPKSDNSVNLSIRAPLENPLGAAGLAAQFPNGGGRAAAAGINNLPINQLDSFTETFRAHFAQQTDRLPRST